jgi:hypothetical protein
MLGMGVTVVDMGRELIYWENNNLAAVEEQALLPHIRIGQVAVDGSISSFFFLHCFLLSVPPSLFK